MKPGYVLPNFFVVGEKPIWLVFRASGRNAAELAAFDQEQLVIGSGKPRKAF